MYFVNILFTLLNLFFHLLFDILHFIMYNYHITLKAKGGHYMSISMGEKVKIVLKRRNMTLGELAEITSQSRQNLSNKLTRDNFSEKELMQIATALNCTYHASFTLNDTGEEI